MKISIYKKNKIQELKKKALNLHKQGMTTREIGTVLNRSRNWVSMAVRELSTVS